MKTIIYCGMSRKDAAGSIRRLRIKLPNYLIKRKISSIREKIITRKYGIIYLVKVFGRYYPSKCKLYYEKKLLKKFFEKLKAHWFEEKEIYRLLYKADVFFNEKLIKRMFNGWQSYATKLRIVKQQARIVKHNYDELMVKNVLCRWKTITNCKKKYKLIRSNATELYYLMCRLLLLLKLAKYYTDEIEAYLLEVKSILCGRFFILRKSIRKLRTYTFQQRDKRILRCKAANYYRSKVIVIYFSHWQRFVCYNRTKREIVQLCTSLYEDGLLKMAIRLWKNKTKSQIVQKEDMLLASQFHEELVKRKLIKAWRRYVEHKLEGRSLKHKASFFHTMRLKQKVLNALSKHVSCCKNTRLAIQKLKLFYRRLLIVNIWNEWTKIIDEKNDSELRHKLSLATYFYKRNITRKYLTSWVLYSKIQQRKKTLKLKAIDLCIAFYCKRYLNVWKIAYRKKERVRMLEEKALKFFDDSLISNAISRWIKSYNYEIAMKAKYEKSVLHHERKITYKCFASWISFCNEKIRTHNLVKETTEYYLETLKRKVIDKLSKNVVRMKIKREKIQIAENLYKKNLVIKGFTYWREYCIQSKELKKKVEVFNERMQNKLKGKIVVQLKLYVRHKKCNYRKTLISETHRRRKACAAVLKRLKNYVLYRKEKNLRLAYLKSGVERIQQDLMNTYFQHWRMARFNILKEKCRIFHADEFHKSHLKHKHLLLWRTFLKQHKIKRQHKSDLNNVMNDFILNKYLRIWYMRYQALLYVHVNEGWASKIYDLKIRHKYFTAWKYFAQISIREKTEINNAKEFHKKLVIKEGLQHLIKLFLSKTESRYETQLRNVERNSSHEFELLRKYFSKWHKTLSIKSKNRLEMIKDRNDPKEMNPTNLRTNDRKCVSNLIPRFIIPEFMKNEIKLRFGIGKYSNQIPINVNGRKILESDRFSKADRSFCDQKWGMVGNSLDKFELHLKNKIENDEKFTNNNMRSQHLRLITTNPNKSSVILSPDSLKSDSDSAKTYVVKSPSYLQNLNRLNSSRNSIGEKYKEENNYELLPPAAFYVSSKQ